MHNLLRIIFSFYPTFFIYLSIPSTWMKKINGLGSDNATTLFIVQLIVFGLIFFGVYVVMKKFVSMGYHLSPRGGAWGILLMTVFAIALFLIAFYNVLGGDVIYNSPALIDAYLLKNPYTFLFFLAPLVYLFFE